MKKSPDFNPSSVIPCGIVCDVDIETGNGTMCPNPVTHTWRIEGKIMHVCEMHAKRLERAGFCVQSIASNRVVLASEGIHHALSHAGLIPSQNTKLCRRVGRRKATMKPETQQPHPVGSSAWFGLVRSARAKCPKCGKKGMGYAGHPHAFGYKDYTRLLCRYCHARFKTPDERPNEKVSASGGENQKPK